MDKIYFAKVNPHATIPSKREEDGCYDIYACFDEDELTIKTHEIKLVSTGIASAFSSKYRIALRERGSNTKSTLNIRAGQIDSGYRGEYFVGLYNGNHFPVVISKKIDKVTKVHQFQGTENETDIVIALYVPYSKAICQFAIEEVPSVEIEEITYDELMNFKSERGCGKLGSSNK